MRKVELSDRVVYVKPLTFRAFKKLFTVISSILTDLASNTLKPENYLDKAEEILQEMTSLTQQEIENMPAGDVLKVVNACVDVITSDEVFLQEVNTILSKLNKNMTSLTSQKS